jgi:hypothetical protein
MVVYFGKNPLAMVLWARSWICSASYSTMTLVTAPRSDHFLSKVGKDFLPVFLFLSLRALSSCSPLLFMLLHSSGMTPPVSILPQQVPTSRRLCGVNAGLRLFRYRVGFEVVLQPVNCTIGVSPISTIVYVPRWKQSSYSGAKETDLLPHLP